MTALLNPRLGQPSSYTVHPTDPLLQDLEEVSPRHPFDATWAVELVGGCIQVLAGERFMSRPRVEGIHPRMLASLRSAGGSRRELLHPRIRAVRFQRGEMVVRVAGVAECGLTGRAFTAEFRPTTKGWWLTHLGVI